MHTLFTLVATTVRQNIFVRLYKFYIIDSVLILKRSGFKELVRQRGWRFLFLIFAYYLIRDTLLYIILPLCVAKGLF